MLYRKGFSGGVFFTWICAGYNGAVIVFPV